MKGTAFLYIIFISGLFLAGWGERIPSNPEASGTPLKIQTPENRTSPHPRLLLADRYNTQDRIIYSTDPDMERAMEEEAREQKEKEDKSWEMLQRMYLYKDIEKDKKHPRPIEPR